jgi:putative DNA primase/helicase
MSEAQYWREVENARPRFVGALFDAVSCALRRLPEISLARLPRMADFACWVTAAEPALACEEGAFLRAYEANRQDANELAFETSLLAPHLKSITETEDWSGTATELLSRLSQQLGADSRQRGWPQGTISA